MIETIGSCTIILVMRLHFSTGAILDGDSYANALADFLA